MTVRSSVVPASSNDRENELRRAEHEAAALESQLFADSARLDEAAGKLSHKLQQVKAAASSLQLSGVRDSEFQSVHQRLHAQVAPAASIAELRDQALEARRKAVEERLRLAEQGRQRLQTFQAELSQLNAQLADDERVLSQLAERHREQEAEVSRRHREQEAEKARAAAGAKTFVDTGRKAATPAPQTARAAVARREPATISVDRRDSRVRLQTALDLHSESNFFQGFSNNVADGGLFVATVKRLPPGTSVEVQFTLPGGKKLQARGVVRWTREVNDRTPDIFPGVGVQFSELAGETAEAIHQFVTEREPLFFPESL